jgi:hypothetical protein
MPDKYSLAKCEQYGRRLAARLCQQRFEAQPDLHLDGPALLQLTPVRQVNLLVLHQLLGRWQHEAEQLRSPYFDFTAEPVQTALGQLMNVLSRHIAVGRAALEPLLAQAVAATLLLATDPLIAFERLLLPPTAEASATDEVSLDYLRERLRYLDLGKSFFAGFVESLPSGNAPLSREFLQQRLELYRASNAQQLPALAPLVAELSALLPLTEADLWDDGPSPATPKPAPAREVTPPATASSQPQPAAPTQPEPAVIEKPAQPVKAAPTASEPVTAPAPPAPQPAAPAPHPASAPSAAPTAQPAAPATNPAPSTDLPLYEKLKATQAASAPLAATLREAAHGTAPSLAERGAPKVGSLRAAISMNQRYSFINELFNGENMEYHAAIEHLDQLPTAEAAAAYIQQELAPRYDWGSKEEHVAKLQKLLDRRFAAA